MCLCFSLVGRWWGVSLLDIDLIMFSKYGDAPLCKQALQTLSTISVYRWWPPDEVFTSSLYDCLLFSRATSSHWTHWFYTCARIHTHTHTHVHTNRKRRRHSVKMFVHNEKPLHTLVHRPFCSFTLYSIIQSHFNLVQNVLLWWNNMDRNCVCGWAVVSVQV